jgi:hypothetical protein
MQEEGPAYDKRVMHVRRGRCTSEEGDACKKREMHAEARSRR